MKFKLGDKVSFLNEKGSGTIVKELSKETILVSMDDGLEIPYLVSELVPYIQESVEYVKDEKLIKQKIKWDDKKRVSKKHNKETDWEVDLHIHELTDSHKHLTNSQIVSIQMNYCRNMFEKARVAKIKKIYFIHGVGAGVLKSEVRKFLESQQGITFYDAPYRMFGVGATEVNFNH